MKRYIYIFLAASTAFFSCTKTVLPTDEIVSGKTDEEEEVEKEPTGEMITELQAQIAPFKSVDATKTYLDPSTFQPMWEAYDEMGFWPAVDLFDGTAPDQAMFFVSPNSGSSEYSTFSANGWGLLRNLGYYSYYPYDEAAKYDKVSIHYKGQRQFINGNPSSICEFDYLHSVKTTVPDWGSVTFNYSHVGCIAEFDVTVNGYENAGNFLEMTLSTETPVIVESAEYNPSQNAVSIQNKQLTNSMSLSLGRGNGVGLNVNKLDLFLMMCPSDWNGKTVTMTLYDSNGYEYSGTFTPGVNQASGSHYMYHVTVNVTSTKRNLSAMETANSYIVPAAGDYRFRAVKGNSAEAVDVKGVKLLWETENTGSAPSQNSIISNVQYDSSNGFISFTASSKKGNAVIAAYSNSGCTGDVLWSWHLWCTDTPADEAYPNNAGYLMDRNLGALSRTGNLSIGLFYQWGRKDPFPGFASFAQNSIMRTNPDWPGDVDGNASTGTVSYATANPTTFIKSSTNLDWIFSNNQTSLWYVGPDVKTIYDPCPPGYRVIEGSSDNSTVEGRGFWGKAYNTNVEITGFTDDNECILLPTLYGNAVYPKSGCKNEDGTYSQWVGQFVHSWTNYPGGTNFDNNQWNIQYSGNMNYGTWEGDHANHLSVNFNSGRAAGKNVRCMKMNAADPSSDIANEGFGTPRSTSW